MIGRGMRALALAGCGLLGLVVGAQAQAQAQAWPARPITFIVPFAAGGGTDAFARPIAQLLDGQLNQRVIIENRPGAGGTAGAATASKAEPDGYTFFVGAAHHAVAPAIYPKLSYDIEKDFIPIGILSKPPTAVVVHPGRLKARTLAELIKAAKDDPDGIVYGHAGIGTTHHLAGELFKVLTGAKIRQVPYRGSGPLIGDLVAGQIHMAFDGLGSAAPQIEGGTIRGLAVAAPQRVGAFPNLPTAKEGGVDNYEVATWYALFAIKGTPQPIVDRMIKELRIALAHPSVKAAWAKNGSDVPDVTGKEFGDYVSAEVKRWGKVVADTGVKME